MALIASPTLPARRLRPTRPSDFRCPITGSTAFRPRSSRPVVVRVAGQRADAEHELPARGAGVAHREAELDAELVAHPRLALADALHLRGVQRIEFARVARLLRQQPGDAPLSRGEGGRQVGPAGELAADVAVQAAEEGA